ncbi:hypothetical protein J6590_002611 [Homalodisca vitripennis]|nr:hypothetical protein J6590_002611 [Homalodisca vitripennis]
MTTHPASGYTERCKYDSRQFSLVTSKLYFPRPAARPLLSDLFAKHQVLMFGHFSELTECDSCHIEWFSLLTPSDNPYTVPRAVLRADDPEQKLAGLAALVPRRTPIVHARSLHSHILPLVWMANHKEPTAVTCSFPGPGTIGRLHRNTIALLLPIVFTFLTGFREI